MVVPCVLHGAAIVGDLAGVDESAASGACKWARSRVTLGSTEAAGSVVVTVDDDGPGLDPALRDKVLGRGSPCRPSRAATSTGFAAADP
jgi:hypothetical protein